MNTFGRLFRVSLFGESHGPGIGVLIDGCPPGIPCDPNDFLTDLSRRKSGGEGTTARRETDRPIVQSGLYRGRTSGSPIGIRFDNEDTRSEDYDAVRHIPRPGHADFTAFRAFHGFNDPRGGGSFSGRITAGLVAAGVLAKKIISPVRVEAKLISAGGSTDIENAVKDAVQNGDSVGGRIECRAENVPVGLGDPFFASVESAIAGLAFSIPGIKAIEFGAGFRAAEMRGSAFNDVYLDRDGRTASNNAGGINGGLTNGNELVFRVAVRPPASIGMVQDSIDLRTGEPARLSIGGRHDACIALRVPVIVEAACAIALADFTLLARARNESVRVTRPPDDPDERETNP